jgi:serine/threonine protein kinase
VDVAVMGDAARFYLGEMVCALRFLHGKNIVHRDLKV